MPNSEQSAREIIEQIEELDGELPDFEGNFPELDEKDQPAKERIMTQEEDFAKGLTVFDMTAQKLEELDQNGAEIEGIDYDQIRDDRLAINSRYKAAEKAGVSLWDTRRIVEEIVQNENWLNTPDGPMNELVHMHPNPDGGLLYDKISNINDARIVYPSGQETDIDVDYNEIKKEFEKIREGQETTHRLLEDSNGHRDDTYGKGFANAADSEEKSRRGYIRDGLLGIAALTGAGLAVNEALEEEGGNGNGQPPVGTDTGTPEDTPRPTETPENVDEDYISVLEDFEHCYSNDQLETLANQLEEDSGGAEPEELYAELDEDGDLVVYLDSGPEIATYSTPEC